MLQKADLVSVRDYSSDQDKNFLYATWLRGLRFGNEWFMAIDQESYFKNYHIVIERILSAPDTSVKVACLKDDPEVILGYSVSSKGGSLVHWVFVKRPWRSIGIAKSLIPSNMQRVTHLTKVGKSILNKYEKVVFDPFSI